ncbi:hypothetical protein FB451DRAFT_1183599 [Mycena latifolia]|nr:hypothetical protein FB451DRAFT_1183599 [Mycena latifolia]
MSATDPAPPRDESDLNELVLPVPDETLAALCTTDFAIPELTTSGQGEDNDSWEKFWQSVEGAAAPAVCLVESQESDNDPVDHDANEYIIPLQEPAQFAITIAAVGIAVTALAATVSIRRSEFTQTIVRNLRRNNPRFNYVICSTRHRVRFEGRPNDDFSQTTVSLPVWWGLGSMRYQVYTCRAGVFQLLGDGGFLNWAYFGNVVRDTGGRQPRTVTFRNPGSSF